MAFQVKKRGRVTYYYGGDRPTLSALVTEDLGNGDLKIYFAGLTGGYSAKGLLEREELVRMEPLQEVEMVFRCWEKWLQQAEICDSITKIDFLEVHYRVPAQGTPLISWGDRSIPYFPPTPLHTQRVRAIP